MENNKDELDKYTKAVWDTHLINIYKNTGRTDEALEIIARDLADPDLSERNRSIRLVQKIGILAFKGQKTTALKLAESELEKTPVATKKYGILMAQIFKILKSMGKLKTAIDLAEKALSSPDITREVRIEIEDQLNYMQSEGDFEKRTRRVEATAKDYMRIIDGNGDVGNIPLGLFNKFNDGEDITDELAEQMKNNDDIKLRALKLYIKSTRGMSVRRELRELGQQLPGRVREVLNLGTSFNDLLKKRSGIREFILK
ncbi:hypothetical protein [Treponema sp. R6D11]